jgi:hypothetical protein
MPFGQITPMRAVQDYIREQLDRRRDKLIEIASYVGLECVIHARLLPSPPPEMRGMPHQPNYIDDTGNLRGSIGFVITLEGRIIHENFEGAGSRYGKEFARRVAGDFPTGVALIVVAGVTYSAAVSALGYDVLDSSEDIANRRLPELLRQNGFRV